MAKWGVLHRNQAPIAKKVALKQNLMVPGNPRRPNQYDVAAPRRERDSIRAGRQEFSMALKIDSSRICRPYYSILPHGTGERVRVERAAEAGVAGIDTNPITAATRRHKSKGPFDDRSA